MSPSPVIFFLRIRQSTLRRYLHKSMQIKDVNINKQKKLQSVGRFGKTLHYPNMQSDFIDESRRLCRANAHTKSAFFPIPTIIIFLLMKNVK